MELELEFELEQLEFNPMPVCIPPATTLTKIADKARSRAFTTNAAFTDTLGPRKGKWKVSNGSVKCEVT